MALIKCSECKKSFSDKALCCPHCGCPTNQIIPTENVGEKAKKCMAHLKELFLRHKKLIVPIAAAFLIIGIFLGILFGYIIPEKKYKKGLALMENGDYGSAIFIFKDLGAYKDSVGRVNYCVDILKAEAEMREKCEPIYQEAIKLLDANKIYYAKNQFEKIADYSNAQHYLIYIDAICKELYEAEDLYRSLPSDFLNVKEILGFIDTNRFWSNRLYYHTNCPIENPFYNLTQPQFFYDFRSGDILAVIAWGTDKIDCTADIVNWYNYENKWNANCDATHLSLDQKIPETGIAIEYAKLTPETITSSDCVYNHQ